MDQAGNQQFQISFQHHAKSSIDKGRVILVNSKYSLRVLSIAVNAQTDKLIHVGGASLAQGKPGAAAVSGDFRG